MRYIDSHAHLGGWFDASPLAGVQLGVSADLGR